MLLLAFLDSPGVFFVRAMIGIVDCTFDHLPITVPHPVPFLFFVHGTAILLLSWQDRTELKCRRFFGCYCRWICQAHLSGYCCIHTCIHVHTCTCVHVHVACTVESSWNNQNYTYTCTCTSKVLAKRLMYSCVHVDLKPTVDASHSRLMHILVCMHVTLHAMYICVFIWKLLHWLLECTWYWVLTSEVVLAWPGTLQLL